MQMHFGSESLALRYLVSLGFGYLVYLLTIRMWAAALIRRNDNDALDGSGLDLPGFNGGCEKPALPEIHSGGGGDFGGGGASGDFSGGASGPADSIGDLAGSAIEAAANSDEGAIVPVVAVFLIGCAIFLGAGMLMLVFFGWEVFAGGCGGVGVLLRHGPHGSGSDA
jgi:hypothetical protein